MKRFIAVALALVLALTFLAACASDPEPPEDTATPPAEDTPVPTPEATPVPEDKDFEAAGLTITLTENFDDLSREEAYIDFAGAYKSDKDNALVTVKKDTFSRLTSAGFSSVMSLKEYAQSVVDAGGFNCKVEDVGELTHFIYNLDDDSVYSVVYRSEDAYWTISFTTLIGDFLRLQERFKTWALSVDVGEGPGISNLPPVDLEAFKVYYYDTYGDIASDPSIMWGDKGWGGWVKNALVEEADGWYSFTLSTDDIVSAYNMLIFFNGLPDSDPEAIQWVWHIDRGAPNGHYFVADMANELNPPANNYQGWQRDCNSYATLEEANAAIGELLP